MKDRLTSYNGTAITYGSTGTGMWIGGSSVFFADAGLVSLDNAHGVSYTYDSSLRRKQKTANGVTTQYYYAGDELMAQTKGSTTLRFKRSAAGEYVGLKYNNTNYYYVKNLQGDVIGIADANGTVKVSYLYDAWGRVLSVTGTLASTLGADNPIRYRSYYYDTETGWYFLGSRYYNPEWCRFISADDPSVLTATMDGITDKNLYAYCDYNPVVRVDEDGKFWNFVIGAVAGAVINSGVKIIDNLLSGKEWNKGVGTALWTGALSGLLAASGAGIIVSIAGNAAISMAGNAVDQIIENKGFDNFDYVDMAIDGIIGAFAGAVGGRGMGNYSNIETLNNNLTKKVISGSWTAVKQGAKYYFSQTKTLYKRFLFSAIRRSGITSFFGNRIKNIITRDTK